MISKMKGAMKNKILFLSLLMTYNLAFAESIENLISESDVVSSHYINLNKESTNYVYIVDYNQKNGYIQNFIDNELQYVKSGVNVRYLPIKTGNKNLCFNKKNTDDTYYISNGNCSWIKSFSYLNQAELPLAVFSDGNVVKVAVKMNSVNLNQYFNIIESNQVELIKIKNAQTLKEQQQTILINQNYINKLNNLIIFSNYYNNMMYNSYYSFYSKDNQKQFSKISFVDLFTLNNNKNNLVIKYKFEKLKFWNIFNYFKGDKYNTNELGFKPKSKVTNVDLSNQKQLEIKPIKSDLVKINITNNEVNKDPNIPTLMNVNQKPKSRKKEKSKLLKKDSLGNGNSISYYSAPPKKHIDFSWGKGGKPVFNKPVIYSEEDPSITIKNN